jgi:hypothetical protein
VGIEPAGSTLLNFPDRTVVLLIHLRTLLDLIQGKIVILKKKFNALFFNLSREVFKKVMKVQKIFGTGWGSEPEPSN